MSEFGSSKSFSSVSESSASSSSPPSSSGSSEEVHTCHRCGDCCYSDKSWFEVKYIAYDRKYMTSSDCTGEWHAAAFAVVQINNGAPLRLDFVEAVGNTVVWEATGVTLHSGSSDTNNPFHVITTNGKVRLTANCTTGAKGIQCFDASDTEWYLYDDVLFSDCCGYHSHIDGPCEPLGVPNESVHHIADIDIELKNNPCCRDTITDECFQHFGGDCRGDCDEEPSSSYQSSSEGNPLP